MTTYTRHPNPWNLSGRQCASLDAVIEHGCLKEAAIALGISLRAISVRIARAKKSVGVATNLSLVLEWDRLVRAERIKAADDATVRALERVLK